MTDKVCREIIEFAKQKLNAEFGMNPNIEIEFHISPNRDSVISVHFTYSAFQQLIVTTPEKRDYE